MPPAPLLFVSGVSATLGGGLRIASAFVPWRPASAPLEVFYLAIDLLLLFGLIGIYLHGAPRTGVVAALAFAVALAGLASLVGPDPIAFGLDGYAVGSAVLALGLAAMGVPLARGGAAPTWVAASWVATPVAAAGGGALGWPEEGFLVAGLAFGAGFVGAGRELIRSARRAEDGAAARAAALDLNQVTLPALELEPSIAYYERFGLRPIVYSPENGYARLELPGGDATLSLHVVAGRVREPTPHVYFETASPEAVVARLREAGLEPELRLEDKPWLWREAWYVDPAGNRLCVYHAGESRKNPPWRVGGAVSPQQRAGSVGGALARRR